MMSDIARRDEAPMLHGTLTTFRRRYGKAACHCATGDPHESPALTYRDHGRTKTITLSQAELVWVRAAVARYQQASAQLETQARDGLAGLRASRDGSRR